LPPRFISVYALEGGGEKEGEGKVGGGGNFSYILQTLNYF